MVINVVLLRVVANKLLKFPEIAVDITATKTVAIIDPK